MKVDGAGNITSEPGDLHLPSPSEAAIGFAAWLTTRREVIKIGATESAARMAELVEEYRKAQSWPEPREDFPKYLKPAPDA